MAQTVFQVHGIDETGRVFHPKPQNCAIGLVEKSDMEQICSACGLIMEIKTVNSERGQQLTIRSRCDCAYASAPPLQTTKPVTAKTIHSTPA